MFEIARCQRAPAPAAPRTQPSCVLRQQLSYLPLSLISQKPCAPSPRARAAASCRADARAPRAPVAQATPALVRPHDQLHPGRGHRRTSTAGPAAPCCGGWCVKVMKSTIKPDITTVKFNDSTVTFSFAVVASWKPVS